MSAAPSAKVVPLRRTAQPVPAASYGRAQRLNPVFTQGKENACPACHARAWHVGRSTAECAACGTALAIVHPASIAGSGS